MHLSYQRAYSTSLSPPETLTLLTPDNFPLKITHFPPSPSKKPGPAILIAAATGVSASFYHPFANYLATKGSPVITIDYRYSGLSFPSHVNPRDREATLKCLIEGAKEVKIDNEWSGDLKSGLEWLGERYDEVVVVGHSVGGHMLTLLSPTILSKVSRSLWVGVVAPHHSLSSTPQTIQDRSKKVLAQTEVLGYFPSREWKFGNDLPAGVGKQWFGWMEYSNYLAKDHAETMSQYTVPTISLSFADDTFTEGNTDATDNILHSLSSCPCTRINFHPSKLDWPEIGHVKVFHPSMKEIEGGPWDLMREWLVRGKNGFEEAGGEGRKFNGGVRDRGREARL